MRHTFVATSLIIGSLLSACSESRPDFECSCDVSTDSWDKQDTLSFAFHYPFEHVNGPSETQTFIYPRTLALHLAVRYKPCLDMDDLSLHLRLTQADGTAISGYSLKCPLSDSNGVPKGSGWGSLATHETDVLPYSLNLPDTGSYRLLIWPEKETENIFSITMGLKEKN